MRPTPSQTVGPFFSIGLEPIAAAHGVRLWGTVFDGEGAPVPDALVETWQAERFARCPTDDDGRYEMLVAPAPFADVSVFARGLLNRVVTRVVLDEATGDQRFDIRLQGRGETVFFAL